ncbi:unnamed protein product [Larinioides sclopetarius]|uniref:Uncharacterized protein n=1 Tax=Larinioides sclopetarius TaxID=280406 RepID=A0AAV2AIU0_9ARAC
MIQLQQLQMALHLLELHPHELTGMTRNDPIFTQWNEFGLGMVALSSSLVQANQSFKMKLFAYIVASAMALLLLMAPAMGDDTTAAGSSTPSGSTCK